MNSFMSIIKDPSKENTAKVIQSIMENTFKIGEPLLLLKNEISGLKLESGETLLNILQEYEQEFESITNQSFSLMNEIPKLLPNYTGNQIELLDKLKSKINVDKLNTLSKAIFNQMRIELGIK
jgi:hypothetical protein